MYTEATKVKPDWSEVKGKIKSKFGKLTDDTVESLKDNLDILSTKLQSAYGYAKDKADRETASFKESLLHTDSHVSNNMKSAEKPKVAV